MKKIILLLIIVIAISISAFSLAKTKLTGNKQQIDISKVDFVEIRNHSGEADTIKTIRKRLNVQQTKEFAEKWNDAKANGPCKYIVLFWVDVTFKDATKRTFRINGKSIKEKTDYCFDIDYDAKNLWNQIE